MMRRFAALLSIAALAACGGGGAGSPVPTTHAVPAQGSAVLSFKVPAKKAQARAHVRRSLVPLDASPGTKGVGISVVASGTPPPITTPQYAFDLSTCSQTGSTPCTQNPDGSRTYSVTTPTVPIGTYTVQVATWDAAPVGTSFSNANELSEGSTAVAITQVNAPINVTLNGIPASVVVTPIPGQSHVLTRGTGYYTIVGNLATQWSVTALDHDGYIIAGNAAPVMSFSDSANALVVTTSGSGYAIKATSAQPTAVKLTATATAITAAGNVTATGSESILPVQELWQTENAAGIFGYMLDPGNSQPYHPPGFGQNPNANDVIPSSDNFGQIAQDRNGDFWVVDNTTNTVAKYTSQSGSLPPQLGSTSINISAITPGGLAADANGFLYLIDAKANTLHVYNVNTGASVYTVPVTAGSSGISVVPAGSGVASGLAGTLLVGSNAGIDLYTNAQSGTPTLIKTIPAVYGSLGNVYSAAVAPDTGTMWTMEGDTTAGTVIGLYSTSSGPTVSSLSTSAPSCAHDLGYTSPGIANYGFTSDGTNGNYVQVYTYVAPSISCNASFTFSGGGNTNGVLVTP